MTTDTAASVTRPEQWVAAAANYQAVIGKCTAHGTRRLIDIVHGLVPFTSKSYALDVGAGAGSLTFVVHGKNAETRILATDIAEPMLKQIDAKAVPSISTQVEDALTLSSLEDASFTHGLSSFTIQFTLDPAAALKSLSRVIAPGGTVGVAIWGEHVSLNEAHTKACHRLKPEYEIIWPFAKGAWRDEATHKIELEKAGFCDVAVETVAMPIKPGNAKGAADFWFRGMNPVPHMLVADWVSKGGSAEDLEREYEKIIDEDYEGGNACFVDGVLGWGRKP